MPKSKKKPSRQEKLAYLDAALKYVENFGTAIDVGAHWGLWSHVMAKRFDRVYAYEPMSENCDAWKKRMELHSNAQLDCCAIGDQETPCRMDGEGHSKHYAVPSASGAVRMVTLDSLGHEACDFLKTDCEGADLLALKGGEKLIRAYRPVIIVEILRPMEKRYGIKDGELYAYLDGLGYRHRETHWRDHIFTADK